MTVVHMSFYVSDLYKSLEFYTKLFGCDPEKIKAKYLKWELPEGLVISFIENPELVQSRFGHLGFRLNSDQDLEVQKKRVIHEGLVIREEMATSCCFAVQDKFWVEDPDGIQWEYYVFKEDAEFNDPHYSEGGASACCM